MKKTLLAGVLFALAPVTMLAATCQNGVSIATLAGTGACTVGSSNQWQLSNFTVFAQNNINFANISASDLILTWSNVGTNGFSLQYTVNPSSTNFFSVNPTPPPAQEIDWGNGIWITGLGGSSTSIVSITNQIAGTFGGANITLRKVVQDQSGTLLTVPTVCYGCNVPTSSSTSTGSFGNLLSVNDRMVLDAGGAGSTGGLTSYTNTFLAAQGGVPEPMTFALMGAGLVGIAILRRRQ